MARRGDDACLWRSAGPHPYCGGLDPDLAFHPTDAERKADAKLLSFESEISYRAFRTEFDSEPGRWLAAAMTHVYGEAPVRIRTAGGSIPISPFITTLGVPAVGVPSVNPDNNQHSPNENIRVGHFVEGIRVILAVLAQPID